MLSKQVADREASGRAVLAAFETHGPIAAAAAQERLSAFLGADEAPPDIGLFVTLLQRCLAHEMGAMTAADAAHTTELNDDPPLRDRRDSASSGVVALVTTIRGALTTSFGSEFGGRLGAVGNAPTAPGDVLSWGRKVRNALKDLVVPAADLDDDGNDEVAVFSKEAALKKLDARLRALDAALTTVAGEVRAAEATQTTKDKAMAAHDEAFAFAAGLLERLLVGAGEADLAAKVRPSVRRPGLTADDASDTRPTPPVTP